MILETKNLIKPKQYRRSDEADFGVGTNNDYHLFVEDFTSATDWHLSYHFEDNSTEQTLREIITQELQAWVEIGKEEVFEDGMDSSFSGGLTTVIRKFGNLAIEALSSLILNPEMDVKVTSEAMRLLGFIDDQETYRLRLQFLEGGLSSHSPRARDGAAIGLSYLDDPHAIPFLQQAMQRESIQGLRENFQQVLEQLESTQQCHPS